MSALAKRLIERKNKGQKGLIIYLTAGYPDMETTLEAVLAAEEAGADLIEIGIPFSDPIADGPVIQKAATEAIKAGATTAKALDLIKKIRAKSMIPLAAMTYTNTILHYGPAAFMRDFGAAGMNGVIVPDLPLEEADLLAGVCKEQAIDLIQFIAPTSTPERINAVSKVASGFVYCISTTGVTGVQAVNYQPIAAAIEIARKTIDIPVAIGFGIGTPVAARQAAKYADAVIVGSAVVKQVGTIGVTGVKDLVQAIRTELDREGD
ncbi:MAG: Tryptophan synthase alpha chain [Firmicutes bacterium]|nr:Tryptophan synthase alpha chain [Bacillota bacterium]